MNEKEYEFTLPTRQIGEDPLEVLGHVEEAADAIVNANLRQEQILANRGALLERLRVAAGPLYTHLTSIAMGVCAQQSSVAMGQSGDMRYEIEYPKGGVLRRKRRDSPGVKWTDPSTRSKYELALEVEEINGDPWHLKRVVSVGSTMPRTQENGFKVVQTVGCTFDPTGAPTSVSYGLTTAKEDMSIRKRSNAINLDSLPSWGELVDKEAASISGGLLFQGPSFEFCATELETCLKISPAPRGQHHTYVFDSSRNEFVHLQYKKEGGVEEHILTVEHVVGYIRSTLRQFNPKAQNQQGIT